MLRNVLMANKRLVRVIDIETILFPLVYEQYFKYKTLQEIKILKNSTHYAKEKITEKAVWGSIFLAIKYGILNADLAKLTLLQS